MVKATQRTIPLSFTLLICLTILLGCGKKEDEETTQTNSTPVVVATPAPIAPMSSEDQDNVESAMGDALNLAVSADCNRFFAERTVQSTVLGTLGSGQFSPFSAVTVSGPRPRGMRGFSSTELNAANRAITCQNQLNRIAAFLSLYRQYYGGDAAVGAGGLLGGYLSNAISGGRQSYNDVGGLF